MSREALQRFVGMGVELDPLRFEGKQVCPGCEDELVESGYCLDCQRREMDLENRRQATGAYMSGGLCVRHGEQPRVQAGVVAAPPERAEAAADGADDSLWDVVLDMPAWVFWTVLLVGASLFDYLGYRAFFQLVRLCVYLATH